MALNILNLFFLFSTESALISNYFKNQQKIALALAETRAIIGQAELSAKRKPGRVALLAVSKTKAAHDVACAYACGQRHFAESYLQEALSKQHLLGHYNITWHFIGPIQSNKTRAIAAHFSWVHSVDRLKIAQRLSQQRPSHMPPLMVCLQVNVSEEATKSGVTLAKLPELIAAVGELPNLKLRGVMAIPAAQTDFALQRLPYRSLVDLVNALNKPEMSTFSFGMSGDLQAAIEEGATIVRVGTGIFGKREYPEKNT